jgi:hypothetical protein
VIHAPPTEIGAGDLRGQAIAALVRAELAEEAAAGFPTLQRIPSTAVVKLLDHLATLPSDDIGALLDI